MGRPGSGLAVYARPRLLSVLLMGFASGLPLALTGATLAIWLAEAKVSMTDIGFFALVGLSYNFKFLWAPVIDRLPVPVLTKRLGRRRSWTLVFQVLLAATLLLMGGADPATAPARTALCAVLVAFFSASQDIVIDAYRVELLHESEQGAGAAATQAGYRLGMIASGAGALYAASAFGWTAAYAIMAGLMGVGIATVLATPEPQADPAALRKPGSFDEMVVAPFKDFMRRRGWLAILIFAILYKLSDAVAGHMAGPFYVSLGFTKPEIASISKVFGVVASILGISLGGIVVYRLGTLRALLFGSLLQMLSTAMYILQARLGHDVPGLAFTIGLENLAGGVGSAAFVAYLSGLCSRAYTATQYALLSALAAFGRSFFASYGGVIIDRLGWIPFFEISILLAFPGLLLLLWLMRRTGHEPGTPVPAG